MRRTCLNPLLFLLQPPKQVSACVLTCPEEAGEEHNVKSEHAGEQEEHERQESDVRFLEDGQTRLRVHVEQAEDGHEGVEEGESQARTELSKPVGQLVESLRKLYPLP
uniref:Putative secreted protein n=1 Tax=Ixodes scapularis TaxID=6945 RepID=A0A4D5RAY6_IXOSC